MERLSACSVILQLFLQMLNYQHLPHKIDQYWTYLNNFKKKKEKKSDLLIYEHECHENFFTKKNN